MITGRTLALSLLVVPAVLSAQVPNERVFYYPKPVARTAWQPPMNQGWPESEAQDRQLRVMTYNIKHGQSNTPCTQPPVAALIALH